jgi:hypothetical protein
MRERRGMLGIALLVLVLLVAGFLVAVMVFAHIVGRTRVDPPPTRS